MAEYDIAVIGSGPGGYVAAIRAAQKGAKTVVIERESVVGGVCLNWGCIPTKTLIHASELYRQLKEHGKNYGVLTSDLKVDLKQLVARKDEVVKLNAGGVEKLLKANGVDRVKGDAVIQAPGHIKAGDTDVHAKAIIIATGSEAAQIPGLETDGEKVITSTEALELTELPEKITVIGAGALGAEFACLWNNLGSKVTLVEMMPQVLPFEDEELTKRLGALWKRQGMDVRTGTKVSKINKNGGRMTVELEGDKAGEVESDLVLVGIGRKYNAEVVTNNPDLGVKVGKRNEILVNDRMETNVKGIYAVGDVTGITMLAHGASAEGLVAVENALGGDRRMSYRVLPACTFTTPEVAHVGLTEKQAKEQGIEVKTGKFMFMASGRAQCMAETDGMVKIVGDARTDEVLGVHIMGAEAGELIAAGATAMQLEATVAEIAHTIHTHPTLSEAIMEAAEDYYGMSIHTPPKRK